MHLFSLEYFQSQCALAQEKADAENVDMAVGCNSYSGYIIVRADDKDALYELTDVACIKPVVTIDSKGGTKHEVAKR
jgi:hypothetical protein